MKKDIAIIGLSGRFPKSDNIEEFWKNLVEEKELIHFFTDDELEEKGIDKKVFTRKNYIKAASFVANTNFFDYPFFKYTLDEARIMNPQTRMMHHLVWEALEDAACDIERYSKKIGIFLGANKDLNWSLYASLANNVNVDELTKSKMSNPNFMASLIAHKLNFKGPCYFIDTACSTSLSTVHLACRSLLLNECGTAVVGGIRLLSENDYGYKYQEGSIMSIDGHNRSFDSKSSGTIGSDGAGVIVLKRLEEAIKDNDTIYAVIKGSAMNNDGNAKAGYTMPSVEGQIECIKLAHKIAGVVPEDISYIEAHGTGTKIGDPIEIEALNIAFNNSTSHKCAIGTVKSNMGHADEAAGIAGLIKTALSLNHKTIPASLYYESPNPTINFNEGPFYVNHSSKKWENVDGKVLTAGVSSLGIGGTNIHVILQEAPINENRKVKTKYKLVRYSAQTEDALERYEEKLLKFIENKKEVSIEDLSYTLQIGRKQFDFRKYLIVKESDDLIKSLKDKNAFSTAVHPKNHIIFMFSGQGSQYVNMGKDLYETYPLFKETLDKGLMYLNEFNDFDYKSILFNSNGVSDTRINETLFTQPILFLFEYTLAQLLVSFGVKPNYMIGHSLGEYVAATIGGVFTFKDALKIVAKRAELMSKVPKGEMLSIGISINQIKKEIIEGVSVAAINSHDSFVVSGTETSIALVKKQLESEEIPFVLLKTSHAFHSAMMNEIQEDFENELKSITLQKSEIPFISNITGNFITDEETTSTKYWSNHITEAVKFEKGIKELITLNNSLFIEVGPGRTLATFYKKSQNTDLENDVITTIKHHKEIGDDNRYFADFLGQLWSNGIDINWDVYYEGGKPNRLSIPTYDFDSYDVPSKVTIDENFLKRDALEQRKKEILESFYILSWKYIPRSKNKGTLFSKAEKYLFFNDGSSFNNELIKKLKADGKAIIEIIKGERFEEESPDKIIINPGTLGDYDALNSCLRTVNFKFDFIIYAWELSHKNAVEVHSNYNDYNLTYNTILTIIKAFKLDETTEPKKIVVINDKNNIVTGAENSTGINQHTDTMLNVLTQEFVDLYGTSIDIDVNDSLEKTVLEVSGELEMETKYYKVAFRNGRRWVPNYESLDIGQNDKYRTPIIKENGNYLIVGVLDDVEYALASHLLEEYKANVIILSNASHQQWNEKQKQLYEKLKEHSGTITSLHTDIADYESFLLAFESIEGEHGTIHGIVHTARNIDITEIALVNNITDYVIEKHFSPRVNGFLNIERITRDKKVDFVKVISSLSSFLGGISYGAYASASALMDSVVLQQTKANWSIINLDRVQEEEPWINQKELVATFHNSFIYDDLKQIIISKRDIHNPINTNKKEVTSTINAEINRKTLKTRYTEPKTEKEFQIVKLFEDLFGLKGVGTQDDFFSLGGDSLKAMVLINLLRKETGITITISEIFSNKTVYDLSLLIEEKKWLQEDKIQVNQLII
jgi:acyl transferase domain-containing protein/acyl carrier protein